MCGKLSKNQSSILNARSKLCWENVFNFAIFDGVFPKVKNVTKVEIFEFIYLLGILNLFFDFLWLTFSNALLFVTRFNEFFWHSILAQTRTRQFEYGPNFYVELEMEKLKNNKLITFKKTFLKTLGWKNSNYLLFFGFVGGKHKNIWQNMEFL